MHKSKHFNNTTVSTAFPADSNHAITFAYKTWEKLPSIEPFLQSLSHTPVRASSEKTPILCSDTTAQSTPHALKTVAIFNKFYTGDYSKVSLLY